MGFIQKTIQETIDFWKPRWLHWAFVCLIWFTGLTAGREDALGDMGMYLIVSTLGGVIIFCYFLLMFGGKDDRTA
jgi:hypothetical protein